MDQPSHLQDAAHWQGVHWHCGPQAQACWLLACWQPQGQAASRQVAHLQLVWVVEVMAFLLWWLNEMPV
jgi:hypothetical protein